MNFKLGWVKVIVSIVIGFIIGFIRFYQTDATYASGADNSFFGSPESIVWWLVAAVLIYLVWSLIQKKK